MTVILPSSTAPSGGWSLLEWIRVAATTDPAVGGVATATLPQLPGDEMWLIDHAAVSCASAAFTEARWYESYVAPSSLLDGTSRGNFDVADWPTGLMVRPSHQLVVQWTGATNGARGTVVLQARRMIRS